ncbi:calmodulin-like protein 3 [Oscarella lobularis]|uniref:calmodulin-like protein 3 n=1 Tax=Oscarella lobularis TaxID=121494 RepID=UPI0033136484
MAFSRPPLSKLVFKKYDLDESGFIDTKELKKMVYDLGHKMTQTELVAATQILDKNNDGRISYKEFSDWWNSGSDRFSSLELTEEAEQRLTAAIDFFKFYDKDHSGDIDRKEFRAVYDSLKKAGHSLGSFDDALASLDTSGDGLVSLNEYVNWLMRTKALKLV